jgi:AraC-like DNA-binding protein
MSVSHSLAAVIPPSFGVKHRSASPANIIEDETQWRARPSDAGAANAKVIATKWRSLSQATIDVSAETPADSHVVAIVLRNENVRFSVAGRVVHDGAATPGMLHVTEPAVSTRCIFRSAYDVLHLHVPNRLIAECARDIPNGETAMLTSASSLARDPTVEWLGRSLLAARDVAAPFGELYTDCISTSIVARLLASAGRAAPSERSKVAELPRWRLKRVMEFVEASLGEAVTLADLAAAAGLTRMHFAAQFRAATGLRPHEYVLRRRIERAQEMLANDDAQLVDIALTVGFQTQSHFTSVFKRFAGQPPHAWRSSHAAAGPARERDGAWCRREQPALKDAA